MNAQAENQGTQFKSHLSLTEFKHIDTMAGMPIPQDLPESLPGVAELATMGARALWLQRHLAGRARVFLNGRDRGVLTLVATHPYGLARRDLLTAMRALGLGVAPVSQLELARLESEGWINQSVRHGVDWIDLPAEDTSWIAELVAQAAPIEMTT